ncbi:hypothetical protein PRIPAC_73269 [Pristionchus pacificus]|uniref:Uncharacterized protein n=1 Tax=Pristionchus pacificus TaxID=54126 RepID=A0A2A6CGA9_PRIPA|nr:hypothetical protein PRIPAC_73269 [Pristionchus pacificus]|eukprot:PDM77118.1 hypothetical protein PRIPAC_43030 [Pristionchus pacificus]
MIPACCPAGGVWSEWTVTGACPTTCGSCNNATRVRTCTSMVDSCPCTPLAVLPEEYGVIGRQLVLVQQLVDHATTLLEQEHANQWLMVPVAHAHQENYFFCGMSSVPVDPVNNCLTTTTTTLAPTTTTTVPAPACCPAGGIWSDWTTTGTCPTTCGSCNNATRTRTCKSMADGSGCPCTGVSTDTGPCGIALCPFPTNTCCFSYVKSLNYQENYFFCGESSVPVDPVNNCLTTTTTTLAPTTTTTVPAPACCPAGGIWSDWTTTGTCPTTCGSCNNATRTRTCKSMADGSGCPCTGVSTDSGPCGIALCPFPTNTCCFSYVKSLNYQENYFFCGMSSVPVDPVNNCLTTTTTTLAPTTTTTAAVPACCPAGGIWSDWTTTGTCPTTCGSCNNATRTRTCKSMTDGSGCPCTGASTDTGPCGIALCPFPTNTCCFSYVKSLNYQENYFFCGESSVPLDPVNNCISTTTSTTTTTTTTVAPTTTTTVGSCCPVGGLWTEWVTQGTCPTTCGSCSTLTRTRVCSSAADGCPCVGATSETGPCGNALCPFPTNTCCGTYVKSLNYKTNEFYCGMGDDVAPPTSGACCPINSNTYWSTWSDWTATCLTTGGQTRRRVCSGADKGCNCDGSATESQQCCCPTGGVWNEWVPASGTCATSCGSCTTVARTRTCASTTYGCPCTGASSDTGPCSRAPCATGTICCTGYSVMINPNTGAQYCGSTATAIALSGCCNAGNMGTWGQWTAFSGACNVAPCGLCDKQTRTRDCTLDPTIGCPCDGDASQSNACGSNKLCTFPTKTCCAPYIKSLINNTLVCA